MLGRDEGVNLTVAFTERAEHKVIGDRHSAAHRAVKDRAPADGCQAIRS